MMLSCPARHLLLVLLLFQRQTLAAVRAETEPVFFRELHGLNQFPTERANAFAQIEKYHRNRTGYEQPRDPAGRPVGNDERKGRDRHDPDRHCQDSLRLPKLFDLLFLFVIHSPPPLFGRT